MTTVVQSSYTPRMRKGSPGLIFDESGYEVATRRCDGTVGFGLAVSEGVDGKASLGGGAFLGISARDVTLDGVPLLPLVDTHGNVDEYDDYRNMAVMTRGRIWVEPDTAVAANDPVYFDYASGLLGNSAGGESATGYIEFTGQPQAEETITLGGVAVTYKASGATGLQVNIGPTLSDTLTATAAMLNASTDETINNATYEAYPEGGAQRLNVSFDTPGLSGNTFGLATTVTGASVSDDTLTGGTAGHKAYGEIVFTTNPADGKKIVLNGTNVVFKNSPGLADIQIGGTLADTLNNLVTDLNNHAAAPGNDAQVQKCTYAGVGGTTLTISFDTVGLTGNEFTISTDVAGATASGAHLTGGAPVPALVTGAYWVTSSLADGLAVVSLGVQR